MARTTLDLPDDLMRAVRIRAVNEGHRLKDVIADLIRRRYGTVLSLDDIIDDLGQRGSGSPPGTPPPAATGAPPPAATGAPPPAATGPPPPAAAGAPPPAATGAAPASPAPGSRQ